MTYFIHSRGYTFFPKAVRVDGGWYGIVDIVSGEHGVVPHRTPGTFGTGMEAIHAARSDAGSLADMLKRCSPDLDTY